MHRKMNANRQTDRWAGGRTNTLGAPGHQEWARRSMPPGTPKDEKPSYDTHKSVQNSTQRQYTTAGLTLFPKEKVRQDIC